MPLTLVLGPANSAKAGEMLGAYAAAVPRGALLVVPTAADARHYTRELAEEGAVLGTVLTFSGLAAEIGRRTGYLERVVTPLVRERVLRASLREVRFDALAESASSPGFLAAIGDLIAELQRSLITPEALGEAVERCATQDPGRWGHAREVVAVYSAYLARLDRLRRVDRERYAWRALDALRSVPGRWGTDQVFFYGFDDLHPLERDAVETLSQHVGVRVMVSLTYEAGRAALEARAEVVEELRRLATRVLELPAVEEHYEPRARRVLHHLERGLFTTPGERLDPGAAVRLLEAGGERAEAELVGAEVLSLLRAGIPGEEIAVVCRSLPRSAEVLETVFGQYGIPVALDRQIPFGATALGRGLLALARCALTPDQARADDLLQYLRSPGRLQRLELADRLEAELRREAASDAAQAIARLGFELEEIDSLRETTAQGAELARQGRRLMAAPARGQAALLDREEQLDARALRGLIAALADLEEIALLPEGAELLALLEELPVDASRPARPGAVELCEPLAIRARRFAAVFVFGLQESEFPRPAPPDPFFSDEHRMQLAAAGGLRLRRAEDALARERYLFYSAVSRATAQVILSWRSSDEEGNLALPSPFIDDVAELLVEGWPGRRRRRLLSDLVWPPEEAPTERELRHSLAAACASPGIPPPERSLSEVALRHARHREVVSGGALEAFADCPVKWLVERELSPPRFEPEPDPVVRGTYMHGVLEELIARLGRPISPESLPDALEILDQILADRPPELAPGRSVSVRAAAAATIEADLRRYVRHEAAAGGHWDPRGQELRFGFEGEAGALPPLVLGEGPDRVTVRGVIDRVDADPSGSGRAIVRDYKSGPVQQRYQGARWRGDRQLQVALYMLAVRELMGLDPVAGLYQPLGGGELRARGIFLDGLESGERLVANDARSREELEAELEDAARRAVEVTRQLRSGALEPCPHTCSRNGCMFPGICRSEWD